MTLSLILLVLGVRDEVGAPAVFILQDSERVAQLGAVIAATTHGLIDAAN